MLQQLFSIFSSHPTVKMTNALHLATQAIQVFEQQFGQDHTAKQFAVGLTIGILQKYQDELNAAAVPAPEAQK